MKDTRHPIEKSGTLSSGFIGGCLTDNKIGTLPEHSQNSFKRKPYSVAKVNKVSLKKESK